MYLHRLLWVGALFLLMMSGCEDQNPSNQPDDSISLKDTVPRTPRWLEVNRMRMILQRDGRWGYDYYDIDSDGENSGVEFPRNSGNFAVYAGGLYIGAMVNGNPEVLEMNWGTEFSPGRISNQTPVPVNQLTSTSADSSYILFQSSTGNDSADVAIWPSDYGGPWNAATSKPIRITDLDTWSSSHDLNADSLGQEAGQPVLGLEVRRMTYSRSAAPWNNTILIRFQIVNKSDQTYTGAYVSWWLDHNLGNKIYNDAPATDTLKDLIYTYNLTPDETSTGKQYAIGHRLLYFSEDGLNSSWSSSYAYVNGFDPSSNLQRYRIQQGGINYGNGGLVDSAFAGSAGGKYVYPGDPVTGTGTLCTQGRNGRLVGSVGPFVMESGKTYDLVVAVIGGEGTDRLNAITDLRSQADAIKAAFDAEAYKYELK